jgi:hypothetical protein
MYEYKLSDQKYMTISGKTIMDASFLWQRLCTFKLAGYGLRDINTVKQVWTGDFFNLVAKKDLL